MPDTIQQIHTLAADGAALVFALSNDDTLPRIVHWGADPGSATAADYGSSALPLLAGQHDGWQGRPGIVAGPFPHVRLRLTEPPTFTATTLTVKASDAGIEVVGEYVLTPEGVLRIRYTATNTDSSAWNISDLRCLLPVPDEAQEILDFTGRWALERVPQRLAFAFGTHARENRRGRTGHDAATVLAVGTPGFSHRAGQVWAVHIGWSGNHEHLAERLPDATAVIGGGELLHPGEVTLRPGQSYTSPWAYFAWSDTGLDGIRGRFHRYLRSRPQHPRKPRPVVLNTWEAVYFNHDLGKLKALADQAADVGVERFVLDDGWFRYRRDDHAGLGDWFADETVWPDGLKPLADHVHERGMQFGLWFEPEMVNPNSDLYRAHPDWVLADPGRLPYEFRQQHTLDLANPSVFAYLLDRLSVMVTEATVDFIKWDHNRDLIEAPQVHDQTLAVYQLFAALKQRHPHLEIESCSSGGARIDFGVLEHTDRVWTSDTNDPLDRQQIQLWTGLLLPPELMGAHVGPEKTHITGRVTSLGMRCATALFGHAGLEWDLTSCSPRELAEIADWITLYKRSRELLHTGAVVVPDRADESSVVIGVVSADQAHALFSYAQLTSTPSNTPLSPAPIRLRFAGLAPLMEYTLKVVLGPDLDFDGAVFGGRALETIGVPVRRLNPAEAMVFEIRKVGS
ncbi:alpha-galactosidase [Catelliglobosispora koreensis]|uniref:alpha-galactosidase n=1 Tax=Catelliglobosispora koreensis TaxID=129052 RepID=UPI00035EEA93|nr:alpha-galactosidase [Catelliglobosispora koreensis]